MKHFTSKSGSPVRSGLQLTFALQAASSPILNALTAHNVLRQKGTLVVVLLPRDPSLPVDLAKSTAAVKRAEGMLRREVAAAITRKDNPNLRFIVLPVGTEQTESDDSG